MSSGSSFPGGRGRGNLLSFLQRAASESSPEPEQSPTAERKSNEAAPYSDSGIRTNEPTPPSQRNELGAARGKLLQALISASSDDASTSVSEMPAKGRAIGRGQFFQQVARNRVDGSQSSVSAAHLPPYIARMALKNTSPVTTASDEGHGSGSALPVSEQLPSSEVSEELEVVERRGTHGKFWWLFYGEYAVEAWAFVC